MPRRRSGPGVTDPREVDAQLLRCRDTGHVWEPVTLDRVRAPFFGTRRTLRCPCGTVRLEIVDSLGGVASRSYVYEADYRAAARLSKRDARAEVLRRWAAAERVADREA